MVLSRGDSKQQRELRKTIASRIESNPTQTVDRVARDFGVSPSIVYRACAEQGVSLCRPVVAHAADPLEILARVVHADAETPISQVARDLGVTTRQVDEVMHRARKLRLPLGSRADASAPDVAVARNGAAAPA